MEQTMEQGGAGQRRVEHFLLGGGGHQDDRLAPVVLALLDIDVDAAGVELGHLLHHEGGRVPAVSALVSSRRAVI